MPEGVVNVVVGPGRTCGQRLVEHPDVGKIAFTGSTEVGRSIAAAAARHDQARDARARRQVGERRLRRRRPRAAAAAAPGAVFDNAGQDCCARSRILVERAAVDEFLERAGGRPCEALRVGDPLDEATEMGPLISAGQREAVASYVPDDAPVADPRQRARRPGVLVRADRAQPGRPRPTARRREEIFGPVAAVMPVRRRGRGGPPGQRHDLRPVGLGLDARRRARRCASRGRSRAATSRSTRTPRCASRRRSAASSSRATAASSGPHALDHYTEVKTIFIATEGG